MKAVFLRSTGLILTAALAACTTPDPSVRPVQVTSFHLGQPIAHGTIAIETFDVPEAGGPEFQIYAGAVARQLTRLGWTVVPPGGQSEQVALVGIEGNLFRGPPKHSPVMIGIGAGGGDWHSGVGGSAEFPVGGGPPQDYVSLTLQVRMKRRSDQTVIWEGRSSAVAHTQSEAAQPVVVADRLAEAMFRYFPGESGRTIGVK